MKKSKKTPSGLAFVSPVGEGTDPDLMLSDVSHWIAWNSTLPAQMASQVKDVLKSNKSRLDVFLQLMAVQRTRAVQVMLQNITNVGGELFSHKRIHEAPTAELIQIYDSLHRQLGEALAFIKGMTDRDPPPFVQQVEIQLRDLTIGMKTISTASPERREDLRSMLMALAKHVGHLNGIGPEPDVVDAGIESAAPADISQPGSNGGGHRLPGSEGTGSNGDLEDA